MVGVKNILEHEFQRRTRYLKYLKYLLLCNGRIQAHAMNSRASCFQGEGTDVGHTPFAFAGGAAGSPQKSLSANLVMFIKRVAKSSYVHKKVAHHVANLVMFRKSCTTTSFAYSFPILYFSKFSRS